MTNRKKLPEQIVSGGFVYRLETVEMPDEGAYELSYSNSQKQPRTKVFMHFYESSMERCVEKAWKHLATTDERWQVYESNVDPHPERGLGMLI